MSANYINHVVLVTQAEGSPRVVYLECEPNHPFWEATADCKTEVQFIVPPGSIVQDYKLGQVK